MRHTDQDYWLYAAAYLTLGAALIIVVSSIIDVVFFGEKFDLAAAGSALMLGILILCQLHRRRVAEARNLNPPADN